MKCSICDCEIEEVYDKVPNYNTCDPYGHCGDHNGYVTKRIQNWEIAGGKTVCLKCWYKIKPQLKQIKEVKCVKCPKYDVIPVEICHKCVFNFGFSGQVNGIRCNYK